MEAEILTKPPISGDYEEHGFDASGNTMWVKFMDSEYIKWCGVFGIGWKSSYRDVQIQPKTNHCYVLAGGQIYIVDIDKRNLILKTKNDDFESFVIHQASGAIVATDGLRIIILNNGQEIWSSNRISLDGITFLMQDKTEIYGKLNDCSDEWCDFKFNVETQKISADWLFYENLA